MVSQRFFLILLLVSIAHPLAAQDPGHVQQMDPAMEAIVSADARIEKVVGGYRFLEGPVWVGDGGYLVFSDIPGNKIYKWDPSNNRVSVVLDPSGFTGSDATGVGREVNEGDAVFYNLGSNGITLDNEGRLVFNAMGDRQIVRMEADGSRTTLARDRSRIS